MKCKLGISSGKLANKKSLFQNSPLSFLLTSSLSLSLSLSLLSKQPHHGSLEQKNLKTSIGPRGKLLRLPNAKQ